MLENSAHIAYLRTYAAHSDHLHAPEVCRQARAEIERVAPKPAPFVIEQPELARGNMEMFG